MEDLLLAAEVVERPCYRETRHSWFTERAYTQNIQHHIWDRESGLNRYNRRGSLPVLTHDLEFYKSITPRLSILCVGSSLGYIRKFTPDGKLLVSFSLDHNAVSVYQYKGVGAVQHALYGIKDEGVQATYETGILLTDQLFHLLWNIPLFSEFNTRWTLNREFSIFIENGHYVLLAAKGILSAITYNREHYANYPDLFDDNEMYDYKFYLVDLVKGCISDEYQICDLVFLSHNYGVSVHGNKIAILSRCRQCIDVLEVRKGKFFMRYQVNREQETARREELEGGLHTNGVPEPEMKGILSQLKQHCIANVYKDAIASQNAKERRDRLREFYKDFLLFERMKMIKTQFVDDDLMLIRFECPKPKQACCNQAELFIQTRPEFKLYVFYSLSQDKVLKCYPYNSVELLYMQRNFHDTFRNMRSMQTGRPASTPSNNIYFRSAFNCAVKTFVDPRRAAERLNPSLPVNAQGTSCAPYFNYYMFNYDDRRISSLEVPKNVTPNPILFTDRYTSVLKFRIILETSRLNRTRSKQLVTFVFHPYEPFIISIQHIGDSYLVNFHLYCETTVVSPGERKLNNDLWAVNYD
ncbi:PREDICTED: DET1 homolog [Rhagoletis zephyria]|uniref:DET1 homolog n=1 Tax=Rhagoletis zephyria TaxID=28612 RepID=UPI0008118C41|nr:PREDICTED: DET1 homolog [Rhagoletis zephyria]